MPSESIIESTQEPGDLVFGVSARFLRHFKVQVEDWYEMCCQLSDWEERHLTDEPTPAGLAQHKRLLDELEAIGRWIAAAARNPDFPDPDTAALVTATLQDLKDRRALWHGGMNSDRRQEVLREVFDESGT
jgi:hypothetical protein